VAIDAPPPGPPRRSRLTERELRWFGIQCFNTPSDPKMAEHPFYEWMTIGFQAFRVIEDTFPRYRSGAVKGSAIEVFPHATAVVLSGFLPPKGMSPHAWRRTVLRAQSVDAAALRSTDQVDAALAALTGLFALERRFSAETLARARSLCPRPRSPRTRPAHERRGRDNRRSWRLRGDPRTGAHGTGVRAGHDAKRVGAVGGCGRGRTGTS
jgi:predicted RNase H-like nuclease